MLDSIVFLQYATDFLNVQFIQDWNFRITIVQYRPNHGMILGLDWRAIENQQ